MAGGKTAQSGFQPDSDVHISFEDQQKINKFARQNAKMEDLKEELKLKQNELQNLKDAVSELDLFDDDAKIPYHIGEIFVDQDLSKTLSCLEDARVKKEKEIVSLEEQCTTLRSMMTELKTQLYAKFGNHINLEADEE
ncbi:prefoldin subunit 4 [Nasonia vitripennis]|uniref:Prefoldin subunit 4 n=1 Tax=Nasonia vitripennis TaxID=7425 RepID=A0A7M7G210_NASVI|nr:prefoldin subunit 4 [Nasonia vitripennis]XP_032455085.1 prefoldin subunit 4 [Nasonia vitripennis]XP_032455086.1 prefoldin subunit 4 [Nasonia vitripennis]XP_032455087.1 prefoldin subunit 4 [Nasonia vitripennis]